MSSAPGKPAVGTKQFRRKQRDESDDDAEEGGAGTRAAMPPPAKRPALGNTFGASTATGKAPSKAEQEEESRDNTGTNGGGDSGSFVPSYAATKSTAPYRYGGDAFATSEIDTAADRDGRALLERKVALQNEVASAVASGAFSFESGKPREYKGLAGYSTFTAPKDATEAVASAKAHGTMGPLRAPTNVRGICRVDYQPDVCKDYKETGYCTFGDSCKFLHDRSDYKAGWQVENDWQELQKKKKLELQKRLAKAASGDAGKDDEDEDEEGEDGVKKQKKDEDGLPFACFICRQAFSLAAGSSPPVVTQCGHYFCEKCAVDRYNAGGDPKCAVCGKPTNGIFNAAAKLIAKLKKKAAADEEAGKGSEAKEADEEEEDGGGGGWSAVQ